MNCLSLSRCSRMLKKQDRRRKQKKQGRVFPGASVGKVMSWDLFPQEMFISLLNQRLQPNKCLQRPAIWNLFNALACNEPLKK